MERPEGPLSLPPLSALRTFEVVARHGSFTRAAQELCVTQTAVSHQIRQLEETLEVALFLRHPRRVELTAEGQAWASALHPIFSALYEANRTLRMRDPNERPVVSVTVVPSFATCWLVPRLGEFMLAHPTIDLHLSASRELIDLRLQKFDVAIRYGRGRYPGTVTEKLMDDAWIPVATPDLLKQEKLRRPADLTRSRTQLIRDDEGSWNTWFESHALNTVEAKWGPVLTDSSMIVDAVVRGQGVGLLRQSLVHDAMANGKIVRLFPRIAPMPSAWSYYIVCPKRRPRREAMLFCEWLKKATAPLRDVLAANPP